MSDFRFVLRLLRRSPGFVLIATATLGLGIAANTAMFSLFYQVLLRSLQAPEPQRLVVLHSDPPNLPGGMSSDNSESVFSYPMYRQLRDGLRSFEGLAARSSAPVQIGLEGSAIRGREEIVSGNFFDVLKIQPRLGRLLSPTDDGAPGANPVAVLSYDFWVRRFGAHPSVLNRSVLLNGQAFTIVGVSPPGFRGVLAGDSPDLFLPVSAMVLLSPGWHDSERPNSQWLTILGRLAPNVSRERAAAELQPLFSAIVRDHVQQIGIKNQTAKDRVLAKRAELRPAAQGLNELERQWRTPLIVLLAMASLLLLIAAANLANLLAARAANRSREMGMRLALGASRGRIVRLLLIESGVLALSGTAVGVILAPLLNRLLLSLLPADAAGDWISNNLNLPLLAFSAAVMIAVTVMCGLLPAIQATRAGLPALGERNASSGRTSSGLRRLLVAGQVALSLVLLVCAGLFAVSLAKLMRQDFGFRPDGLLTFTVDPGLNGYSVDRGSALYRDLLTRLSALPAVDSVAIAQSGPLSHSTSISNIAVEGFTSKDDDEMLVRRMAVGPGYFRTLGTPLIEGREFEERDGPGAPKVGVVNQAFATRFFGGHSAVGRHMSIGAGGPLDITIAGVVAGVRNSSLHEPPLPTLYIPYEQSVGKAPRIPRASFFIRTTGRVESLPRAVQTLVAGMDNTLPVFALRSMDEQVNASVFTDRLIAALSIAFGALALILTAVGLYGLIAYLVTRRTTEIGVRMALGATRSGVIVMIVREAIVLVCAGGAAGLLGASIAVRSLQSQLFGMAGFQPLVFLAASLILLTVALCASAMPAWRAARIPPSQALRHE